MIAAERHVFMQKACLQQDREGIAPTSGEWPCTWLSQQLPYHSSSWRVVLRAASCKDQLLKLSCSPCWTKPPQEVLSSPTEIAWAGVMGGHHGVLINHRTMMSPQC